MKKTMTILMALVSSQAYAANQYIGMGIGQFDMTWNRLTTKNNDNDHARNNTTNIALLGEYGYVVHPYISVGIDLNIAYTSVSKYPKKDGDPSLIKNTFNLKIGPNANIYFMGTAQEGPLALIGVGVDYNRYSTAIESTTTKVVYPESNIGIYANLGLGYNLPLAVLNANNVTWSPAVSFVYTYRSFGDGLKSGEETTGTETYSSNWGWGINLKLINFKLFF